MCLQYKYFGKTVGKGEIARNEQFLLFPHSVFYPFGEHSAVFIRFEIFVCRLSGWKSLRFVVWERVKEKDRMNE